MLNFKFLRVSFKDRFKGLFKRRCVFILHDAVGENKWSAPLQQAVRALRLLCSCETIL